MNAPGTGADFRVTVGEKLPGAAPGTLRIDPSAPKPRITVITFGPDLYERKVIEDPSEIETYLASDAYPTVWVNVDGLGDAEILGRLGEVFRLHRLALEDVVNIRQRAKVEPFDEHLFIVARMIALSPELSTEQVSFFLGPGYVLTFQEREGDCFDAVRQRLASARPKIRGAGAAYLAYALLDALIDGYFPVLETYGERLETLENSIIERPTGDAIREVYAARRDLLSVRRAIWPHREAIGTLLREETAFVDDETRVYLRDCYDHAIQIVDMVETYRELASGLMDLYLSSVSNRMNEVMKVLTIFAAIFIPLSFIAGLYGMNFDAESPWNMPELGLRFGYPLALGLMAVVAGGLLAFFYRRGWIGGGGS